MSTVGGFFCGKLLPLRKGEDPRRTHQYAIVWGRVLKDAEDTLIRKRTVSFYVKYDEEYDPKYGQLDERGRKIKAKRGKFMRCTVTGKEVIANVMASIEREDIVICFGRLTTRRYRTKDGQEKRDFWLTADVVIPMAAIGFVMDVFNSPSIQNMLEHDRNAEMDAFES